MTPSVKLRASRGYQLATVRNWFLGNPSEALPNPLFPDEAHEGSMISFLLLIETVVAARFRTFGYGYLIAMCMRHTGPCAGEVLVFE